MGFHCCGHGFWAMYRWLILPYFEHMPIYAPYIKYIGNLLPRYYHQWYLYLFLPSYQR